MAGWGEEERANPLEKSVGRQLFDAYAPHALALRERSNGLWMPLPLRTHNNMQCCVATTQQDLGIPITDDMMAGWGEEERANPMEKPVGAANFLRLIGFCLGDMFMSTLSNVFQGSPVLREDARRFVDDYQEGRI